MARRTPAARHRIRDSASGVVAWHAAVSELPSSTWHPRRSRSPHADWTRARPGSPVRRIVHGWAPGRPRPTRADPRGADGIVATATHAASPSRVDAAEHALGVAP